MVVARIIDLLNADQVWINMTQVKRQNVTVNSQLTFIREALDRSTTVSYQILNTSIVVDMFRTFVKDEKGWRVIVDGQGQPVVNSEVYREVKPLKATFNLIKGIYPSCYYYMGGVFFRPFFPQAGPKIDNALKSVQRLREIQGSDSSCAAILGSMRDYAGLTDDFGKRMMFTVASVLSVWAMDRPADIQLSTIGDLTMLVSSLNGWRVAIHRGDFKMFPNRVDQAKWKCDVKYLLPSSVSRSSVPQTLRSEVSSAPRDNAVIVCVSDAGLPSAEKKGKEIDYVAGSYDLIDPVWRSRDYIVQTPVYGSGCFQQHRDSQELIKFEPWKKPPTVFHFSTAANFRGVISSFKSLSLVGYGYQKVGKSWNLTVDEDLVELPLTVVKTEAEWYEQVCKDAASQAICWLNPLSRYSPIGNLLKMSKNAVILAKSMIVMEDGTLIPNVVRSPSREAKGELLKMKWVEAELDDDDPEMPERLLKDDIDDDEEYQEDDASDDGASSENSEDAVDPVVAEDGEEAAAINLDDL
jgi:hypothetical protein